MCGLLISMEGIDGCGKSTQFAYLKAKLDRARVSSISIREPGGTETGEVIRDILLQNSLSMNVETELLLYIAARSELCERIITPGLNKGKVVLCDRFTDSTLAYQGYGGGLDLQWIDNLNNKATGYVIPDLTLLLDLPVKEAMKRRGKDPDRMEAKSIYFHTRVRNGYLDMAKREPQRIVVINALEKAEKQSSIIWEIVENKIKGCLIHE